MGGSPSIGSNPAGSGPPSVGPYLPEPSPVAPWLTGAGAGGKGGGGGVAPGGIPGTLNPISGAGGYTPPVFDPMSVLTRGSPASGFIKTSYSPNQYGDTAGGYGGYSATESGYAPPNPNAGGGGGGGGVSAPGKAEGSHLSQPRFDSNTNAIRKAIGNPNYNPRTDVFTEEERTKLRNDPAANAAAEEIYLHNVATNASGTGSLITGGPSGVTTADHLWTTGARVPGVIGTVVKAVDPVKSNKDRKSSVHSPRTAGERSIDREVADYAATGRKFDPADPSTWSDAAQAPVKKSSKTPAKSAAVKKAESALHDAARSASGDNWTETVHKKQVELTKARQKEKKDSGGSSSGGGKIVCTAMNEDYGFGSYRQAIWLKYSEDHLTKAHEVGYHAMFLPLLAVRHKWYGKPIYSLLKHIARHRTADLRAEMQGTKRNRIGQAWRFVLEPLVYTIGRIKGAK